MLADRAMGYFQNMNTRHLTFSTFQQLDQFSVILGDEFGRWTANRYLGKIYLASRDLTISREFLNRAITLYRNSPSEMMTGQSLSDVLCDYSDTFSEEEDSAYIFAERALAEAGTPADSARAYYSIARTAAVRHDLQMYNECRVKLLSEYNGTPCFTDASRDIHFTDQILSGHGRESLETVKQFPFVSKRYFTSLYRSLGQFQISDELNQVMLSEMNELMTNRSSELIEKLAASMQSEGMNKALLARMKVYNLALKVLSTIVALAFIVLAVLFVVNKKLAAKHLKEREEMIRQLTMANEKSQAADKAKTMFVHNMSHEIRTPLNAIVGFSQLLSLPDGMLTEEEKNSYAGYVVNNSHLLTMLVDDILSASDMEGGVYKIHIEDARCNDICNAAIQSTEYRTPDGVKMFFTSDLPDDFAVETDARRVQQVLINYLTNACKHTKKGTIHLHCTLNDEKKNVIMSVTDTGSGVPQDQAENIFERFTKLDNFAQGTGLGLNICKQISDRLGGKVYLDTTYKEGARFVLELNTRFIGSNEPS